MEYFRSKEEMINKIDDVMFKIILKEYEASSVLNNAQRDKIASQVISRILRDQIDVELSAEQFLHLAGVITAIFPTEIPEVYFEKVKSSNSRGKLISSFRNMRSQLISCKLVVGRKRARETHDDQEQGTLEDVTDNVTFLQTNVENEVEILRAWEATYEYRMTKLSATGLDFMSTHEYFELYPYLKEQNGWKLFNLDMKVKYPTVQSVINWTKFSHKVIDKLLKEKNKPFLKSFLSKEVLDNGNVDAIALSLLPMLLTPSNVAKRGQILAKKYTQLTAYKSFFPHFETASAVQDFERTLHSSPANPQQPFVYFIGKLTDSADCKGIVQAVTTKYIFNDPLKAFEAYFSLINGANIHYPHPSEHMFQLIEQLIFGINESGPLTTASRILANELRSSVQPPVLAPSTSSANNG